MCFAIDFWSKAKVMENAGIVALPFLWPSNGNQLKNAELGVLPKMFLPMISAADNVITARLVS